MVEAPSDIRSDLGERYRQLRSFDEAEVALVRGLVRRPDRLPRPREVVLRQALNLARLWVVSARPTDCIVGPRLTEFRERLRPFAERVVEQGLGLDPLAFTGEAAALEPVLAKERESLLSQHAGHALATELDRELSEKALVLALGGGGGSGYVHLGAFSALEALGVVPRLIAGTSMGAILGLFRAKEERFREETVQEVTSGLSFKSLFRILDAEQRYSLPGTLRLQLRSALSRHFLTDDGQPARLSDLAVPFLCMLAGLRRDAAKRVGDYERTFSREFRRGALGRLLHLKDLVRGGVALIADLVATPGAVRPIVVGMDAETQEFDVLDAVGFSSSLPAILQYDILRDDARMHELVRRTLENHGVDHLADGGLAANVPARAAWEFVHSGSLGTRNAFILGLDCFAPQMGRNLLFLPLQRLAAENVAKERAFAHLMFNYQRVLSPTSLVPKQRAIRLAIENGREEVGSEGPFIQKMLEPLPPIGSRAPWPLESNRVE